MFIKAVNSTTDNKVNLNPNNIATWEEMDSDRIRVFTTDGYQTDVRGSLDDFDKAFIEAKNGHVSNL